MENGVHLKQVKVEISTNQRYSISKRQRKRNPGKNDLFMDLSKTEPLLRRTHEDPHGFF